MQVSFAFAAGDVSVWRDQLGPVLLPSRRRSPVGQLIKSMISAPTRDAVSTAAYDRLTECYVAPATLARAPPAAVARVIADVTFADAKARKVSAAFLGFNIAMKRLGKATCRSDVPACDTCPLATECPTAKGWAAGAG